MLDFFPNLHGQYLIHGARREENFHQHSQPIAFGVEYNHFLIGARTALSLGQCFLFERANAS